MHSPPSCQQPPPRVVRVLEEIFWVQVTRQLHVTGMFSPVCGGPGNCLTKIFFIEQRWVTMEHTVAMRRLLDTFAHFYLEM